MERPDDTTRFRAGGRASMSPPPRVPWPWAAGTSERGRRAAAGGAGLPGPQTPLPLLEEACRLLVGGAVCRDVLGGERT